MLFLLWQGAVVHAGAAGKVHRQDPEGPLAGRARGLKRGMPEIENM